MFKTLLIYIQMYRYMLRYKKQMGITREQDVKNFMHICKRTIEIAKYHVDVIGLENIPEHQGVLYTPNHQSFFDVFSIAYILKRPIGFIGKKEFKYFFSVGYYIVKMGGILIDRDDIKSQIKQLRDMTKKLKDGLNVVVFPEGTRSRDGQLGEFKSGTYKMALKSKSDIVPVTYYNNYEVVKNKKDKILKIKIDKPITYEEYKDMSTAEIASMVKSIIQKNLDEGFDKDEATRII